MENDDREKSRPVEEGKSNDSGRSEARPVGREPMGREDTQADDLLDDQAGGEESSRPYREPQERRRNFSNARELMTDELQTRASQSSDRLRACLTGSIIVKLRERSEKYLFDWTGNIPKAEATEKTEGDCVINVSESNLLKIASGDLNPQIGMLSDKISVQGKLSLAVYFFNLIAPFPQN
jgi:putative sterol carrier protein